jgi:hypothetical protein
MRISVGSLQTLAIFAFAVINVTAAQAQSDNPSMSNMSCAGVMPPAANVVDTISTVPIYEIPAGPPTHKTICQATEALAEGLVGVELGEDRVLADALSEPVPDTVTGEMAKFPYSEPGSRPTPGLAPPGPSPEVPEHSHVYAAFVDPTTGVEYTFNSVAENLFDAEEDGAGWVRSTVEPLLKQHAARVSGQAASHTAFGTDDSAAAVNVADAAANVIGRPSYNSRAWTLLVEETIASPKHGGPVHGMERSTGSSGAVIKFYRLNANRVDSDYFLVDTAYTQTPSYNPFTIGLDNFTYWANKQTQFKLRAMDPNHSAIVPSLLEFAPRTVVSSSEQTFSVGANLSVNVEGPSGDLSADYSVTRNQLDVETVVKATLGVNNLTWTDVYNGFGTGGQYPATLINTFTGERLAIFKVPRTVNDVAPKVWAGLEVTPLLYSQLQGFFIPFFSFTHKNFEYTDWQIGSSVFVPEPRFSVHHVQQGAPIYPQGSTQPVINPDGPPLQVSLSSTNVANPVYVDVVAQLPNNAEKVTWHATTPGFVATDVGPNRTGSARIKIYPAPGAAVTNSDFIFFDSVPGRATDSLRNGAIRVPVQIVP